MNSRYMFSLIAVIVLFLIAWAGAAVGLESVFGIIIPYLALITFLAGLAYKVVGWSRSGYPFAYPPPEVNKNHFPGLNIQSWIAPPTIGRLLHVWHWRY